MTNLTRNPTRAVIAWWTLITWSLYAASFVTSLAFYLTGRNVLWFALALLGLVGGLMALRNVRGWRPILCAAYGLVIAWSLVYWLGIIDKILIHEEIKTLSQAFLRIGQMVSIAFSAAVQHGTMIGWLSTYYREILMPLLQVVAVIALLLWVVTQRLMPPNTTVETDARKSSARGSL
jgi:hypothetical protein